LDQYTNNWASAPISLRDNKYQKAVPRIALDNHPSNIELQSHSITSRLFKYRYNHTVKQISLRKHVRPLTLTKTGPLSTSCYLLQ